MSMRTWWTWIVGAVLVIPLVAYVTGSLASTTVQPTQRPPVMITVDPSTAEPKTDPGASDGSDQRPAGTRTQQPGQGSTPGPSQAPPQEPTLQPTQQPTQRPTQQPTGTPQGDGPETVRPSPNDLDDDSDDVDDDSDDAGDDVTEADDETEGDD